MYDIKKKILTYKCMYKILCMKFPTISRRLEHTKEKNLIHACYVCATFLFTK